MLSICLLVCLVLVFFHYFFLLFHKSSFYVLVLVSVVFGFFGFVVVCLLDVLCVLYLF